MNVFFIRDARLKIRFGGNMKSTNYSFYMSVIKDHLKSRATLKATGMGAITGASIGAGLAMAIEGMFMLFGAQGNNNDKSIKLIATTGAIGGGFGFTGYTLFKASSAVAKKVAPHIFRR
jgi:hypothetical protein